MKALRIVSAFVVVVFVGTSVTGCSSAPKMASSPTPTVYQYAPEPQKRVPADEGSLAAKHAKEVQKMRYAHEKRIMAMEMAAEEARIAREKNIAPPPAVSTNFPQVSVRYWTPDDPYGTGQVVPQMAVGPQYAQAYMYPRYTGRSNAEYWARRYAYGYAPYGTSNYRSYGAHIQLPGLRIGGHSHSANCPPSHRRR